MTMPVGLLEEMNWVLREEDRERQRAQRRAQARRGR